MSFCFSLQNSLHNDLFGQISTSFGGDLASSHQKSLRFFTNFDSTVSSGVKYAHAKSRSRKSPFGFFCFCFDSLSMQLIQGHGGVGVEILSRSNAREVLKVALGADHGAVVAAEL